MLTPSQFTFVFQQPQRAGTPQITILGRLNSLAQTEAFTRQTFNPIAFMGASNVFLGDLDNRALSEALEKLWRRHCRLARGS